MSDTSRSTTDSQRWKHEFLVLAGDPMLSSREDSVIFKANELIKSDI